MYHISNDKRAMQSAELIKRALFECLKNKELNKITISDISKESYVSRSTFYRLFDSIEDVLVYMCCQVFDDIRKILVENTYVCYQEMCICFISKWMEHSDLLDVLAKNNLMSIIYDTHMRNIDLIKNTILLNLELDNTEIDYLIFTLSGMFQSMLNVWYLHGKKETPEEMYYNMKVTFDILNKMY